AVGGCGEVGYNRGLWARRNNKDVATDLLCGVLDVLLVFGRARCIRVQKYPDRCVLWYQFAEKLQAFGQERARGHHDACDIAAWPVKASEHSSLQCNIAAQENDRYGRRGCCCCFHNTRATG